MSSRLYTNTSNVKGVIGLLVVTVLTSYAMANSTKIVNDTVSLGKKGIEKVKNMIKKDNKQQYVICGRDIDGHLYDTGRRIWK
jgi:tetrahydromethanopterin S-methyltransferase subunit A